MRSILIALTMVSASILAGCLDDGGSESLTDDPVGDATGLAYRALPEVITGLTQIGEAPDVTTGSGIWLDGASAYVGARNDGLFILDISDPEDPTIVSHLPSIGEGEDAIPLYSRDVDLVKQPNQTLAITAGQSLGMNIIDVTNASAPEYITTIMGNDAEADRAPVHNVAVPPGQSQYVYNSRSTGEGGAIDVVDVSNPEDPKIVAKFGTHGCHDIAFLDLPDKKRAYCPGIQATQIYDIGESLTEPKLIANIDSQDYPWTNSFRGVAPGYGGLHHLAMPNADGTILILGDEWSGGGEPGACYFHEEGPTGQTVSSPLGALTFFDISDEANPELLSWFSPPTEDPQPLAVVEDQNPDAVFASCTSHFGMVVEDRPLVVMGWYSAGILLIDFSDPENPRLVDQVKPGGSVWDARIHQGYVFTGDISRGLDVLTFE